MIKNAFWEFLALLGFWIPCKKHLPDRCKWDWVLIAHREKDGDGFVGLPSIAEYSWPLERWHPDNHDRGDEIYINNQCEVTHWRKLPKPPNFK